MAQHAAVTEDVDIVRPGYTLPSTINFPARESETRAPSTISQMEIAAGYADEHHALADGLVDAIMAFVTTA